MVPRRARRKPFVSLHSGLESNNEEEKAPHPPGSRISGFRVSYFVFRISGESRTVHRVFGFRISGLRFLVSGFGFQVSDLGFPGSDFGSRVSGIRFRVSGFGHQVSGFGFGFRVSSLGFRGSGCGGHVVVALLAAARLPAVEFSKLRTFRIVNHRFRIKGGTS